MQQVNHVLGTLLTAGIIVACANTGARGSSESQAGFVEGRVLDAQRQRPLWRANVYLRSADDSVWYEPPGLPEDSTRNVYTDSTGAYHLRAVPPGEFRLVARFPGYKALDTMIRVLPDVVLRQDARLHVLDVGY